MQHDPCPNPQLYSWTYRIVNVLTGGPTGPGGPLAPTGPGAP